MIHAIAREFASMLNAAGWQIHTMSPGETVLVVGPAAPHPVGIDKAIAYEFALMVTRELARSQGREMPPIDSKPRPGQP